MDNFFLTASVEDLEAMLTSSTATQNSSAGSTSKKRKAVKLSAESTEPQSTLHVTAANTSQINQNSPKKGKNNVANYESAVGQNSGKKKKSTVKLK